MTPRLRLLPLAVLALVAWGHAPAKKANLTYQTGAKRADLVVQEIAAQAGLTLNTTDDARKHYLVVSVTDVDVEQLLDRIAKATSSKWAEQNGSRALVPDEGLRKAQQDEKTAKRIAEFKEAQAKFKERLEQKPMVDEETGETYTIEFESPGEKALMQLAQLINPNEIARLGDDGRLVFSTNPNRMQRPMPNRQALQILNGLVADHNKWAAEQIKMQEEQGQEMVGDADWAAYMALFGGDDKPKMFEGAPAKALLVVEMEGTFFGFPSGAPSVELKVYDQKGVAVIHSELQMGGGWMEEAESVEYDENGEVMGDGKEVITEEQQQKILPEDRVIVKFSEKSKQLMALESMDEASLEFPPGLLTLLRDPEANDPLGFHHTDTLLSIAEAKKLDVVANLADTDMFESFSMGASESGMSVGQAYEALQADSVVENKDGWLLVSPTDPIKARDLRQDRTALKRFVSSVEREGEASLDNVAEFALASPSPMQNGTSMVYLLAFAPQTFQGIFGETMDWPMLRFYGSLGAQHRTALRQGGRVQFSSLTTQARTILTNMAFSSSAKIKSAAKMKEQSQLPGFMQMFGGFMGGMMGGARDYTEEPTEVMPGGLPGAGAIEMTLASEPIARPEGSKTMFFLAFGALGADELAMFELMRESPEAEEAAQFFPAPGKVRLGVRDRMGFTFWLSPEAGLTKTLLDDRVPKDAQVVEFTNLPADFKALIEARKKAIKESPFGKMMGGIGG
jgi:hypothetical protein